MNNITNKKMILKGEKIVGQKRKKCTSKMIFNPQNDSDFNKNDLIKRQYKKWVLDSINNDNKYRIKAFLAFGPFSLFITASILSFLNIFDAIDLWENQIIAICFAIVSGFILLYSIYIFIKGYNCKFVAAYLNQYPLMQELV